MWRVAARSRAEGQASFRAGCVRAEACGAHAGLPKLRASAGGGFGPPTSATSNSMHDLSSEPQLAKDQQRADASCGPSRGEAAARRSLTGSKMSQPALRQGASAARRAIRANPIRPADGPAAKKKARAPSQRNPGRRPAAAKTAYFAAAASACLRASMRLYQAARSAFRS